MLTKKTTTNDILLVHIMYTFYHGTLTGTGIICMEIPL